MTTPPWALVDFSICPHLAPDGMPGNSMAEAESWIQGISGPAYITDGQTAIAVVDGVVEVISEGTWHLMTRDAAASAGH